MAGFLHISNEDACKESSNTGKSQVVRSSLNASWASPSCSTSLTHSHPSNPFHPRAPEAELNSLALLYQGKALSTLLPAPALSSPPPLQPPLESQAEKGGRRGDALEMTPEVSAAHDPWLPLFLTLHFSSCGFALPIAFPLAPHCRWHLQACCDSWCFVRGMAVSAAPESCSQESGGHQLTWGQLRGFWKMVMSRFQ